MVLTVRHLAGTNKCNHSCIGANRLSSTLASVLTNQLFILLHRSLHHLLLVMQTGIEGVDSVALLGKLLLERFLLRLNLLNSLFLYVMM